MVLYTYPLLVKQLVVVPASLERTMIVSFGGIANLPSSFKVIIYFDFFKAKVDTGVDSYAATLGHLVLTRLASFCAPCLG